MKNAIENQTICDDFQRFFTDKIAKIAEKIKCNTNSGSLLSQIELAYNTPYSLWQYTNIGDEEALQAIHNIPPKTLP